MSPFPVCYGLLLTTFLFPAGTPMADYISFGDRGEEQMLGAVFACGTSVY